MNNLFLTVLIASLTILSCQSQPKNHNDMDSKSSKGQPNHLIHETSPYLLQHAYNPVDWHAWNDETLKKAVKEEKLLIISIGYAACHWCHVMEHESFEDSVVAQKMNSNYLPIKVDREERPDVDQIYMNAAHLISGRGGWPLNAIALPDGRPIYAATYFPKDKWLQLLEYFSDLYEKEPEKILEQAEQITAGVRQADMLPFNSNPSSYALADLDKIWNNWKNKIDFQNGGRQGAPKFMMPNNWEYLLKYYTLSKDEKVLEAITTTLNKMADGGLYDHAGGGFARYSTDANWQVPHFEKMLYDNGQLMSLYSHAYQLTKDPYYKQIVTETLQFIERELQHENGGFYSSLDADSEGEEGKFYIWTEQELKGIIKEDYELVADYFTIKSNGNWEHQNNILYKTKSFDYFKKQYNLSDSELKVKIDKAKAEVLKARTARIRPGLDDKILTSWNALMLKGYVDAYRAFDNQHYLDVALQNANFILDNCKRSDGGLNRNFKNGTSTINGFLDDYSLTIEAFIALYQATFDTKWLDEANSLAQYSIKHFHDDKSKLFYYTSDEDAALISRTTEISDNVIVASNSSMATALYQLGMFLYNDEYIKFADQMLNNVKSNVVENAPFFANWASLMTYMIQEPYEVAIVGKNYTSIRKKFDENYLPNILLLGSAKEENLELLQNKYMKGETMIYVCQNKTCKLPVTNVVDALKLME